MDNTLYIIANALHIYALYIFIDSFLGKCRINKLIKGLLYFFYYTVGVLSWLCCKNMTLNLFVNIVPLFFITLLYKSSLKKKFFSTISSCAIGMFIDWVTVSIFKSGDLISSGFIQCILFLVIASLFSHYYIDRELNQVKSKYSWILTIISIGTIAIGVLTFNQNTTHGEIIAIILLMINFLNFYVYNLEQKNWQTQYKLHMIEYSNNAYQHQIELMNESQKKLRYLRHDFKNHLNKIRGLIDDNDFFGAVNYLDAMSESIIVKQEYSKTGNKDVDSLINYELTRASEFGTEIICNIDLPEQLNITPFDMTVILGNLLDNSIDALRQSNKKTMMITIKYKKGIIRIDIENTYNPFYKKKSEKKEHGIGLISVKNTLEKYHGNLKTFPEENKFHTTVVLFNNIG